MIKSVAIHWEWWICGKWNLRHDRGEQQLPTGQTRKAWWILITIIYPDMSDDGFVFETSWNRIGSNFTATAQNMISFCLVHLNKIQFTSFDSFFFLLVFVLSTFTKPNYVDIFVISFHFVLKKFRTQAKRQNPCDATSWWQQLSVYSYYEPAQE